MAKREPFHRELVSQVLAARKSGVDYSGDKAFHFFAFLTEATSALCKSLIMKGPKSHETRRNLIMIAAACQMAADDFVKEPEQKDKPHVYLPGQN